MKYKVYFQKDGKLDSKIVDIKDEISADVIKVKELRDVDFSFNLKDKSGDIVGLFYEMDMMLASKLPLKDVVEILIKSSKNGVKKDILETISKSLLDGQPIHKSLEIHRKILGYLPLVFIKLGEENSNLANSISSLYELLDENQKLKQSIGKALRYPIVLVISLIVSIFTIFTLVVPKFEHLFTQFGANLPLSTTILLFVKNSLYEHYLLILFVFFVAFLVIVFVFIKFRYFFHKMIFLYIPYFSKMYRYMIFYKLFLSIYLIMKSKNKFQETLVYAKETTDNLFVEEQISFIIQELNDGKSIHDAFSNRNIFNEVTLRMLLVGEQSNRLEEILHNLQNINKRELSGYIDNFVAFLTPFFVVIISAIVLWLVLAIMTPIWEMGSFIR